MENRLKFSKRDKMSFALTKVQAIAKRYGKETKSEVVENFYSAVKNLPMYIYTNGLIATLAFMIKKDKKKEYKELEDIIIKYLKERAYIQKVEAEDVLNDLIQCNPTEYRRITLDVLSMVEWLVKFSDGILKEYGDKS